MHRFLPKKWNKKQVRLNS
uniref:Uncharacterized protein n=1 Tax=Rhizophora mucronata TaxID=61149 RepID=A0A2P2QNE1_RHIMU